MLMHPSTKRKKAETRVKSSTWWDRIWVEMRPWNMPKGPRPKLFPRTGKKRSKKGAGQPHSETIARIRDVDSLTKKQN